MSTAGLQAANKQNAKELDNMKESISDIINQLQDIDPTRLSFSPFLDLDTQISLAPVSDSPESSVEELHSSSHSFSGSQHSLEEPPATSRTKGSAPRYHQAADGLPEASRADVTEEKEQDQNGSSPNVIAGQNVDATTESISCASPASHGNLPNGVNATRCSPEPTAVDCTVDEGRPLISPPPESVELVVWSSEGRVEPLEEASDRGQCCCQCQCCRSGRVPAFLSVLASLLCAAGILYALYFYVPIKPPQCPDAASRITFALCCCVVASVPVLLAMLMGAACQFCTASFSLHQTPPPSSDASAAVRHSNLAAAGPLHPQPGRHGCAAASRRAEAGAHTGHHVHLWKARLLAQPERVQLLARLRLRSDCLPAPGCCGSQSVPHVHHESQRAAARLSGRPL
ncbi:uncharacterized protein [Takifugu rubripes]|uniref:uncharacterized protein n=1 Tax=Takifugu rubripes TaxID=31033 RepID=UPI001145C11A|nr:uncharacterized protein LOC105417953 [Takifugu rubripes]XP_029684495.1 uncharacterized protein LOC105417953 [Takifugu rubripes]